MRVLLDTSFALRGPSGTAVYLERLVPALERLGVEVVEAQRAPREPGGGGLRSAANLAAELRWAGHELPRRARRAGADVLHHPLPAGGGPFESVPRVLTVHDLAFLHLPEAFAPGFRRYAATAHRHAARGADAVVAVSEATARDLSTCWDVPGERIVVAHHGPGQEPAAQRTGAPRHFLYVGDDEPRKNRALLLAAYGLYRTDASSPLPLVLAGAAPSVQLPGVEVVERPDAERLAELYGQAAALVHPSLHEGFGLTPLEAMSAGVPVLAVRRDGVEEICADAARYVGADDALGLAAQLAELAGSPRLRAELSERGRRRAAGFSWERSAHAHLEAYALAIAGRGRT